MKEILQYLFNHNTLTKAEAKAVLTEIAQNKFNENEVTSFVTVFLMRSITLEELEGFCEALMQLAVKVNLGNDLADIVGTGGDGKNTFNISTLASFLVAGAGQKVAKHGNYGVSTVSGSSNVLEELGYKFKDNEADLKSDLEKANLCFLHAPLFHPALKTVAPLRKGLGLRTFYNILGPLVNPAQPEFSVIGVYNLEIARLYQYLLQKQNRNFSLVHALDGYDEVSLTADTKLITKNGEKIFAPEDLGFHKINPEEILGGNSKIESAEIFKTILEGRGSLEQNAVVTANAAIVLESTQKFGDYNSCLNLAKESLERGKSLELFKYVNQLKMNILDKIIEHKKAEVRKAKSEVSIQELMDSEFFGKSGKSLKKTLKEKSGIIAEFKRQSPSKGIINDSSNVLDVVKNYEKFGASAVSILTDKQFFGGSLEDILKVRKSLEIPILRKDFMIDEYQFYEAKSVGADVILLIAANLSVAQVQEFTALSHQMGLEVLLEIHDEKELKHINKDVGFVGINNRNLKDFKVDLEHSINLKNQLPTDILKIVESGIYNIGDFKHLKEKGFDGFLMGEYFMKTENPGKTLEEFSKQI